MSENAIDANKTSYLKIDNVTLATMFVQIKAFNEVLLKNQATILAKLNNEDAETLLKNFKEVINNEVMESLNSMQ
jgi:uncharacterized protein YfeS